MYTIQLRSMHDDEKQLSFGEYTSYIFKQVSSSHAGRICVHQPY